MVQRDRLIQSARRIVASMGIFTLLVFGDAQVCALGQTAQPPADARAAIRLSDQDKSRIRLEEEYRHEIRESLNAKEDYLLEVLNAPFTIWVLSSVILTGLGALYARYAKRRDSEKARSERVNQIVVDLATRIERAKLILPKVEQRQASWTTITRADGAFPEFRGRDLFSLVVELRMLRPDDTIPNALAELWSKVMSEPAAGVKDLLEQASSLVTQEARLTSR